MAHSAPAGTRYVNPIRSHDVPDPDAIRLAGGGFAMVASSFDRRPGLPLWFSDDLVDWQPVGFAGGHAPLLQPSGGVWAPAIREHDDRLWITWADPDRGIFVVDAPALSGPWSEPRLLAAGPGPIDPCPYWDEDGRAWIVHGWARSRAGFANRLDVFEVDPGLTRPLSPGRILIDGDAIEGCTVLEGPKVYRRDGEVWLFAPAGGVETGWQYAFRARSLAGPWQHRIVLEQGSTEVNGPHQGAWVVGEEGEEWFLHFQHTPLHGRILHLQPLTWGGDGWPRIGAAVTGGPAEPVPDWQRPQRRPRRSMQADLIGDGGSRAPLDWHGQGASPGDIVLSRSGGRLELTSPGRLAQPLDRRTSRIDAMLLDGAGEIAIIGAAVHRLVAGATVPPVDDEAVTWVTDVSPPVVLSVELTDDRARFLVDGEHAGEPFPLVPTRWTGMEFALGATGDQVAVFEDVRHHGVDYDAR